MPVSVTFGRIVCYLLLELWDASPKALFNFTMIYI